MVLRVTVKQVRATCLEHFFIDYIFSVCILNLAKNSEVHGESSLLGQVISQSLLK